MTFSGYLNVQNFQRALLATRKADVIALQHYAYFSKDFSNPCRCKDVVPLFERNPNGLRLIFTLDFLYQRQHHRLESWDLSFVQPSYLHTEICRCSSWKRRTFIELFWICLWNNCWYLQTKGWCMAATQGQWCKISECGFARWLDYQP